MSSQTLTPTPLPTGLHHIGWRWCLTMIIALVAIGFGVVGHYQQHEHGLIVTGMRTIGAGGATWGVSIGLYLYFVGVAFGALTLVACARLMRLEALLPLTRLGTVVALICLALGGLGVMADIGRPMLSGPNLMQFARPDSAFYGDFTLVMSGTMIATAAFLFLLMRSDAAYYAKHAPYLRFAYKLLAAGYNDHPVQKRLHHRASFWLAFALILLVVAAQSTLGFVFGIQGGRPGWFSTLQAPAFLVLAWMSGIGMLAVLAALLRTSLRAHEQFSPRMFRWLSNLMWVLILVYGYFMIVEHLTATYAAPMKDRAVANAIVFGPYAQLFWGTVGCLALAFVVLFANFIRGITSVKAIVLAGILVNVAAAIKRFLLVVPSQTHGMLLPYEPGTYEMSVGEIEATVAFFGLGTAALLVAMIVLPLVPLTNFWPSAADLKAKEPVSRKFVRWALTLTTLGGGIVISVVGLGASARVGTDYYLDPAIPWAPLLFVIGIAIIFTTPVVYELVPVAQDKHTPESPETHNSE